MWPLCRHPSHAFVFLVCPLPRAFGQSPVGTAQLDFRFCLCWAYGHVGIVGEVGSVAAWLTLTLHADADHGWCHGRRGRGHYAGLQVTQGQGRRWGAVVRPACGRARRAHVSEPGRALPGCRPLPSGQLAQGGGHMGRSSASTLGARVCLPRLPRLWAGWAGWAASALGALGIGDSCLPWSREPPPPAAPGSLLPPCSARLQPALATLVPASHVKATLSLIRPLPAVPPASCERAQRGSRASGDARRIAGTRTSKPSAIRHLRRALGRCLGSPRVTARSAQTLCLRVRVWATTTARTKHERREGRSQGHARPRGRGCAVRSAPDQPDLAPDQTPGARGVRDQPRTCARALVQLPHPVRVRRGPSQGRCCWAQKPGSDRSSC